MFPSPRAQDGTLDFNIDPAFLTTATMNSEGDVIFNNAASYSEIFHSVFKTDTVHSPIVIPVSTRTKGGGPSDGYPPTTTRTLTHARSPSARSARRIAQDALNPAVQASAVPTVITAAPAACGLEANKVSLPPTLRSSLLPVITCRKEAPVQSGQPLEQGIATPCPGSRRHAQPRRPAPRREAFAFPPLRRVRSSPALRTPDWGRRTPHCDSRRLGRRDRLAMRSCWHRRRCGNSTPRSKRRRGNPGSSLLRTTPSLPTSHTQGRGTPFRRR